jgi:hypothetical protein
MHLPRQLSLVVPIVLMCAASATGAPIMYAVGDSFMVGLNGSTGNITVGADAFLSAQARFTVTQWQGTTIVFSVDIANTSSTAPDYHSRITALGFNVDGDAIPGTSVSGAFSKVVLDDTVHAHGLASALGGPIDVCLKNGNSSGCESGQGGIAEGQSGLATLTLKFVSLPASVALTDFFVRYQGVSTPAAQGLAGVGIATCVDADCDDVSGRTVPEPTVLALFGAGLLGASYLHRRRQR